MSETALEATPETEIVDGDTPPEPTGEDITSTSEEGDTPPKEENPFPKKAKNAINRRDRTIRKLRDEKRNLLAKQAEYEATKSKMKTSPEPVADDFESYGDYLKARQDWQMEGYKTESATSQADAEINTRHQSIRQQQQELFVEERDQFFKEVPDAAAVFNASSNILGSLPQSVVDIIFELDNPVTAIYTLAKEGRLENVGAMSQHLAAAELVAAQTRGQTLNSVPANAGDNPQIPTGEHSPGIPNSPKPMAPAKGTGASTTKSLSQMNARELVNWAKK